MNKKEIQTKVNHLLSSGIPKSTVFANLSGQGIKDSQLAYFIAAHADPMRRLAHDKKVSIIITIMLIQAALGFIVGFNAGAQIGPNASLFFGGIAILIQILFALAFYKYQVGAYNAYIVFAMINMPKSLLDLTVTPISTSEMVGICISICILAYVWYVRTKIFPDFVFVSPKKIKGQYIFTS